MSIRTIDTNPPPVFTPCATNMLNGERGVRNAELACARGRPEVANRRHWYCSSGTRVLPSGHEDVDDEGPGRTARLAENEAKRARQPKSALMREILQQHRQRRHQSALDLAADLCGCVGSGLRDLSRNRKHLKGFGR